MSHKESRLLEVDEGECGAIEHRVHDAVSTERSDNSQLDAVIKVIIPSFQILFYQSLKIPLNY